MPVLPEPDFNDIAANIQEEYQAREAKSINRSEILPPREATDPVVDATNILFGDFGKALGFELDKKGLRWNIDTATDAWTEHPIRSAIEVGINLGPVAFKAMQLGRAGKIAAVSDEAIQSMHLLDEGVDLANVSDNIKDIARGQVYNLQKTRNLKDKIDSGIASKNEEIHYWLNKKFGNSYMEAVDPTVSNEYMNNWVTKFKNVVADNETFKSLARNAPPDEYGVKIAQFFTDQSKLKEIPEKYRPWALQMSDELRTTQSQMLKEGLLANDEVGNVGPAWFSLVREGTPNTDVGAYTKVLSTDNKGKSSLLSIPKTYSPNLLQRKMSQNEVKDFLVRKEAADLVEKGDTKSALSLLDPEKHASVRELIQDGKNFDAVKLLTVDGKVDLTPKNLTVGSMAQQKALLESYRYIRDLAIKYGKKGEELTPQMKNTWHSLDGLQGSDRVRRMVGIAKGMDGPVDELGFIPKALFNEIQSITGQDGKSKGMMDLLDMATAIHKTVKTSLSPGTHFSNIFGNATFMWNGGVNIFGKEYWENQNKAWNAIRGMQTSFREKGAISELENLGSVKSVHGKDISLADELNSKEANNLIEMSSLLSSEGIGLIGRMTEAAKEGSFTKMAGKLAQKMFSTSKLDRMADLYMAEDGATKFAYYLHLRQQGLSRQGASLEVGKRMPMYNSVGEVWKGMRKSLQPWITFPVEATRIMKNNMMDYPLRTAMVMQIPHFTQLGSYVGMQALGRGQTYQTINERKNQLPQWAQRPSTIMTPWVDKNGDFRHATLDFLPYTAAFPESTSKDAPFMKKLPIFQDIAPIMSGFVYALSGKDAWGRDIPNNTITEKVSTIALQTASFLSPPILDKYMFNATDPKAFYRLGQDLGKYPNQYTGKEGDPLFDLFLNSVIGAKTYPSSPEQAIANKEFRDRDLDLYKSKLSKEASALLKIGDTAGAGDHLSDIYQIFLQQFNEPAIARSKFNAFLKTFKARNKSSKVLQGLSLEQIDREMDLQSGQTAFESNLVRDEYINMLKTERKNRKKSSNYGEYNPLSMELPRMPNIGSE